MVNRGAYDDRGIPSFGLVMLVEVCRSESIVASLLGY